MSLARGLSLTAGRLAMARGQARVPIALFPLVIVARYGASPATDCFFLVLAAVQFVGNAFAPQLESIIVPFVAEHRANDDDAAFVKAVMLRAGIWITPVCAALTAAAVAWHLGAGPVAAGWEDGWRHLLVLAWVPGFSGLSAVLAGYLNADEHFLWSAGAGSVRGVLAIGIGLLFGGLHGVFAFAVGLAAGELAAFVWLLRSGPGQRMLAAAPAPVEALGSFWTMYASTVAGGVANSSKGFVDRFFAAALGPGMVSLLEAAERVFLMAVSFIGAPFAIVVLSRWSAAFSGPLNGTIGRLRAAMRPVRAVAFALGLAILLVYPVVTTDLVWSRAFARVPAADAHVVRLALLWYLAGAVPYLLGLVVSQAILVVRDAAFAAGVTVLVGLLNVPMDAAGARWLGLPGIALGTSCLHVVGWLAGEWRLRRRGAEDQQAP
jgi:peptidoglycan biosynthesis protein MviN/MurJ (putative lipid II flippase)